MQASARHGSGAKNVVDFSAYRRRRRIRATIQHSFGTAPIDAVELGDNDDYRGRIVVDAAVFAYVVVLIFVGIWLVDGLTQLPRHPI